MLLLYLNIFSEPSGPQMENRIFFHGNVKGYPGPAHSIVSSGGPVSWNVGAVAPVKLPLKIHLKILDLP